MDVVGEVLGDAHDQAIYRCSSTHVFPAMKNQLWHHLGALAHSDSGLCLRPCARVPLRRRHGHLWAQPFPASDLLRLCLHVRCDRSGRIEAIRLAGADQSDLALLPEIVPPRARTLLADRTSWSPDMAAALAPSGPRRDAPFPHKAFDPTPQRNAILGSRRGRIASTFAHLVERSQLKRVWARDLWHVGNRLVRTVLSHTIAMHLTAEQGNPPLRLALLLV